jgi:hypothetical protein
MQVILVSQPGKMNRPLVIFLARIILVVVHVLVAADQGFFIECAPARPSQYLSISILVDFLLVRLVASILAGLTASRSGAIGAICN